MANNPFANKVIENKVESILTTKLDMNAYLTPDYSLAAEAGMTKAIHTYSPTGDVQDLSQGNGNTSTIEATYVNKEYTVGVTQGRGVYYDEEAMKDPMIVDAIVKGMAEKMVNDFTAKAISEMEKGSQYVSTDWDSSSSGYLFGKFVDAVAKFGENVEGLFCLISPNNLGYLRKQLGTSLQYAEAFQRTGYIGSCCGVPVIVSAAVPDTCAFMATKEAVTAFIKKGVETEQERDANVRKNSLYIRKVAVVALTDATKLVALAEAQGTAATITTYTKAAKTIAGAATTGATVQAYVNGVATGSAVVAANSAYSITADENLAAGDVVKVVAHLDGYADSSASQTVAS